MKTLAALVLGAGIATSAFAADPPRQRQGPYEITLMLPPAGLYAEEEMEIEFRVEDLETLDAAGAPKPLAFARIRGEADMPSMPSMAKFDEIAHREGIPGVFGVHPVFPHGGEYRLCLTILPPEVQPVGDPRPPTAYTFDFPLTVHDATSSPTPVPRRVRPYELEVAMSPKHPVAGEPADLDLAIRMTGSFERREVTAFDVQHEKLMHLFVVRDDLAYFAHEHPEMTSPGAFRLRYRFPAPGRYRIFADVAPKDAGAQVLSVVVNVGGDAASSAKAAPSGPTRAALELPEGGVRSGRTFTATVTLTDDRGRPVKDLEPWLGAMGHLLLVNKDAETFAHAHPDDREPGVGENGRIPFLVRLPKPGPYKGWLQFQRRGKVETIELAIEAAPPY